MCRNIKTPLQLRSARHRRRDSSRFAPVRQKSSGFTKPAKANEASFLAAVDEIAGISARLLSSLETNAPPKNREEEAAKAKVRAAERFGA